MPASTETNPGLGLLLLAFAVVGVYGFYSGVQMHRNREPGYRWWHPVPFSGATLTRRGRAYSRRLAWSMVIGVAIITAALLLYPHE